MKIYTKSVRFFKDVIEDHEYDYLFRDLVVIDVGCNEGMFSLAIEKHAKEIHAIDISKECIATLNKNIEANNLGDKIHAYNFGVSDYTGIGKIGKEGQKAHLGGWRLSDIGTEDIQVYTLEDFMNQYKISHADVLKLDVEGEEDKIINGSTFPSNKITTIIGEYHYEKNKPFEDKLRSMGYYVSWVRPNHFIARK